MMRFRLRTLLIFLAIAPPIVAPVAIAVLGLSPEPITISGRVADRGMPAALTAVEFVAESDSRQRYVAHTDEQGRFALPGPGERPLQAGRYRVIISVPGCGMLRRTELVAELHPESNQLNLDLQ